MTAQVIHLPTIEELDNRPPLTLRTAAMQAYEDGVTAAWAAYDGAEPGQQRAADLMHGRDSAWLAFATEGTRMIHALED